MADHLLLWTAYGSGPKDRRLLKGHSKPRTWLRCRIWSCMRIKAAPLARRQAPPLSPGRPARRAPCTTRKTPARSARPFITETGCVLPAGLTRSAPAHSS